MKSTPTFARIMALHEEQRALWGRTSRLSQAQRGRLLDIAQELESLWSKRRMEKAGIDADRLPDLVVHPYEPDRGALAGSGAVVVPNATQRTPHTSGI